jgi:glycosyltransferase involved in cell wall biosynthesis
MLNLPDIYFLGRVPKNDLVYAYLSADIFVFPTLEEGLGIALLEAMASGLPVVASRTSGVSDVVINGKTGILVSPRNIEALADAIIKVLNNEELKKKIGKNAQEYAEINFNWQNIAKKFEHLYLTVVEHAR